MRRFLFALLSEASLPVLKFWLSAVKIVRCLLFPRCQVLIPFFVLMAHVCCTAERLSCVPVGVRWSCWVAMVSVLPVCIIFGRYH